MLSLFLFVVNLFYLKVTSQEWVNGFQTIAQTHSHTGMVHASLSETHYFYDRVDEGYLQVS